MYFFFWDLLGVYFRFKGNDVDILLLYVGNILVYILVFLINKIKFSNNFYSFFLYKINFYSKKNLLNLGYVV